MEVTTEFIKILRGESSDWDVLTFRVTQDKLQNTADIFSWRSSRTSSPSLICHYALNFFKALNWGEFCAFQISSYKADWQRGKHNGFWFYSDHCFAMVLLRVKIDIYFLRVVLQGRSLHIFF